MGYFNIDLLDYESHHLTEEYINTMNSLSFQPMITKPTRITDHSATLIDHFFFNSRTSFEKNCFSAWASTLNMGSINKVDMARLSPVGYGV